MAKQNRPMAFLWSQGQTHCVVLLTPSVASLVRRPGQPLAASSLSYSGGSALVVTSNGEVWSAASAEVVNRGAVNEEVREVVGGLLGQPMPRDGVLWSPISRLEPEHRLPLEWARRAVRAHGRKYTTLAPATAAAYAMPRSDGRGSVSYAGFDRYAKRSAHKLAEIHGAVEEALGRCESAWGWSCPSLEVKFHDAGSAYGLAYQPGRGEPGDPRKISLAVKLIERHDLRSVLRVVLHELTHHRREEAWPRRGGDPHDATFCRELKLVDPDMTDESCSSFLDEGDPAIVAAIERKSAERKAARESAVVWAPNAGWLEVSRLATRITVHWKPDESAGFRWGRASFLLCDSEMVELAQKFPWRQWSSVRVRFTNWWGKPGAEPPNLLEFVGYYLAAWPGQEFSGKLLEHLKQLVGMDGEGSVGR